jgi:alkylhydroperoxidase family enzyme
MNRTPLRDVTTGEHRLRGQRREVRAVADEVRPSPGDVPGPAEAFSDGTRLPGMVAVPAHPGPPGSGRLILEAREAPGLGQVLPVFSSVGRLVAVLGQDQPWAALPLARARERAAAAGVHRVALDPPASCGGWRWTASTLADFTQQRWHGE